jgi:hypothetical protein
MIPEEIYFMYGFCICFVFFIFITFLTFSTYRSKVAFNIEMRRLEVDAVRDYWRNKLESLEKMEKINKIEEALKPLFYFVSDPNFGIYIIHDGKKYVHKELEE